MSIKSFIAGAVTIALPVALVAGVLHFTHENPAVIRVEVPVPGPAIAKSVWFVKHCSKPVLVPVPVKRRHPLAAVDDGGP